VISMCVKNDQINCGMCVKRDQIKLRRHHRFGRGEISVCIRPIHETIKGGGGYSRLRLSCEIPYLS